MDLHGAGRVIWTAYGNFAERLKSNRTSQEEETQSLGPETELDGVTYRVDSLYRQGSISRDPFLSFTPDFDFGPDCEHFRIKDLGDFTDRFDRTDEASPSGTDEEKVPELVEPVPFMQGKMPVQLSQPSSLLSDSACRALAASLPHRHRWRQWVLVYSSQRDGISLQTLYRRAEPGLPTILAVRDHAKQVFGCFASECWRVAPRYYGNGESFVFQIQPNTGMWRWHQRLMDVTRNDFFQFGRPDRLAMGGGPHYAISLDGDLLRGTSGTCNTFGSPCLACSEEFEIGRVELWALV